MTAAPEAATPERSPDGLSLVCAVRGQLCALPLQHVIETMRPLPIEPLAGAPDFVPGIAIVRGTPAPVVDAARLLGGGDAMPIARFVTLRVGARCVALGVGGVIGVHAIPPDAWQRLPPLVSATTPAIAGIGTLDAQLLLVLDEARLVPEALWPLLAEARS